MRIQDPPGHVHRLVLGSLQPDWSLLCMQVLEDHLEVLHSFAVFNAFFLLLSNFATNYLFCDTFPPDQVDRPTRVSEDRLNCLS